MTDRDKQPLRVPIAQYLNAEPHGSEASEQAHDRLWARISAKRSLQQPLDVTDNTFGLPVPVVDALMQTDEVAISRGRLWRQVRARVRHAEPVKLWPRRVFMGTAFAAAIACVLFFVQHNGLLRSREPLALVRMDGEPLGVLEAGSTPRSIRLSDQSEIRLAPGASVKPLLSSNTRFELLLSRGSAEFSVTPGGPRRWLVEAGAASVEVVGTVFRVDRRDDRVLVSVSHGAVLVRGENVPGWARRVSANESIEVPTHKATSALQPAVEAAPEPVAEPASTSAEPLPLAFVHRPPTRHKRAQHDAKVDEPAVAPPSPHDSYAALGAQGLALETLRATSIDRLLELADIARLSGHPRDAVAPLSRALEAFRTSPQAGLAAFTLGRVLLDQLGEPAAAAEAFERAITLRLPRALLADCYRRLSEAYGRANNHSAKAESEARFHAAFPVAAQSVPKAGSPPPAAAAATTPSAQGALDAERDR